MRELLERRAALAAEMRGLLNAPAGDGGNLSAEQEARFTALKAEADTLEQRVQRQATVDEMERRAAAQPIGGTGDRNLDRELRGFSLVRAIAGQVPGLNVDAGRERELSQELARRAGRPFQGIAVPMAVFQEPMERRVVTSAAPVGGPGGNLIATDLDGSQYIDRLRNATVVRRLGARMITGLVGNLDIPKLKASATVGWVAENAPLTASDPQYAKTAFRPKHAGAIVELSRNLLMQASPDVEQLVRADFAALLAEALDAAALKGTGAGNDPTGILNASGVGSVVMGTNGGALTYDAVADLMGQVEDANGAGDAMAFVSNTKVKRAAAKLKTSQNEPLGLDVVFQNMPRAFTNSVPSNLTKGTGTNLSALIFGNWSDLILAVWSEFELTINPFESTAYSKGNVQVRGMMTCDVAPRHAESFAAIQDIVA
ncbi:phage major capsid protein [Paracraurococcus lichenis]|uniref:Phage major capsid protein n=1 Tax=Paracraurococcus lichenis TaxID=3064888 RepID=A0ABT9EC97_9PROT|nr:phage major capsid protein [Paracraurococcus sp. LOR1-02]MDO9713827.1 phage major capsid protein [Paracraurococcus sp. LOR1-02]